MTYDTPDWDSAPNNARYWAQDRDGMCAFFAKQPSPDHAVRGWTPGYRLIGGRSKGLPNKHWVYSLQLKQWE